MPELPEIETIVRGLAPAVCGRRVVGVDVRERRLRAPLARDFPTRLTGRRVDALSRHGKYLIATLDDARIWLVHLGMSGQLTLTPGRPAARVHDHVVVDFDDGSTLTYNDPRRFGCMQVIEPTALAAHAGSGIDALSPALTGDVLHALARGRKTSVKALLMDQRRIAGLGNIYVSELLFRAGVRPRRAAGRLTRAECARVVDASREILRAAIRDGGSSISDYRDGFGQFGCFQRSHQVYDRAGEACRTCGTKIHGCVVVGRSTFHCPRCQR
jgi:formamidopyrimidine-DNA glycosylase